MLLKLLLRLICISYLGIYTYYNTPYNHKKLDHTTCSVGSMTLTYVSMSVHAHICIIFEINKKTTE